jgi:hypothetical protein
VWSDEVFIGVNLCGGLLYENYDAPALVCTGTSGTCNLDLDDTYITFDIIATDYTSYAIVYICGYEDDQGGLGTVSAIVILTTSSSPSATVLSNANAAYATAFPTYPVTKLSTLKSSKCTSNPTTNAAAKAQGKWSNLLSNAVSYISAMF